MLNFWDFSAWGAINLFMVLLVSLLGSNMLKRSIPFLRVSLIPTSVLGGCILVVIEAVFRWITGLDMFDTSFFGGNGTANLELITYHMLALGFIASSFKSGSGKLTKQRTTEIFNTGVTTVATYLLQAVLGFGISLVAAMVISGFFNAAGVLLPFGYGQGTGQAMNYGMIYENDFGFLGGKSFGLTIAALGFLSASLGGVVHLNILRKKGVIKVASSKEQTLSSEHIQGENEIPMQESMDKLTVQIALIGVSYLLAYGLMAGLGVLLPGMRSVIFGFNFLLGVIAATIVKTVMNFLRKKKLIHREYSNDFLMTRASNFFFDLMVVAGIAAIRQGLEDGWQDTTRMMQEYDRRRRYFVNALNDLGLICHDPEGAFYAFPSIQSTGLTSEEFCDRLLEEENVAVIPGSAFGSEGEGFVRCCYASSMDHLEKAIDRIGKMMRRL